MTTGRRAPRLPAVYGGLIRAEVMATAGYRAGMVVGLLGWVIPFVMMALWRGAAADGAIEGITADQFTTYFGLVLFTSALSLNGMLVYDFSPLVRDGRLAHYLVRPYHPFHNLIAMGLARSLFFGPAAGVLLAAVLVIVGGPIDAGALPTALGAWLIGSVAAGHIAALAGTIALWVTEAYGVQSIVLGLEGLLGGLYAPVALLPGFLAVVGRHNPFWFQVGAPSELLAGIIEPAAGLRAMAEGLVWIVVLHAVFRVVWRRGVRQFELVGG